MRKAQCVELTLGPFRKAIVVALATMLWLAAGTPGNRREWTGGLWRLGGALWIALALEPFGLYRPLPWFKREGQQPAE